MKMPERAEVLQHTTGEGSTQAELDVEHIRKIKREYPMDEL
jgi:hypothetical protein